MATTQKQAADKAPQNSSFFVWGVGEMGRESQVLSPPDTGAGSPPAPQPQRQRMQAAARSGQTRVKPP